MYKELSQGYNVQYFVGTEQDFEGNTINDDLKTLGIEKIKRTIATKFGGFSCIELKGGWVHPESGDLVEETSLCIQVVVPHDKMGEVRKVGDIIKTTMRQYSILITLSQIHYTFLE